VLTFLPPDGGLPPDTTQTFDWLPEGTEALADGEYDAIVLGTGLKECVISGLLSVKGKKVLQLDRNGYYGADGASLNLSTLFEKFQAGEAPSNLGANRDYNVDLIPKVGCRLLLPARIRGLQFLGDSF
jgi:Rab GDP dissociation inhibitor